MDRLEFVLLTFGRNLQNANTPKIRGFWKVRWTHLGVLDSN